MNNIDLEKFIIGLSKLQLCGRLGKLNIKDAVNIALRSQNLQVDDDFRLTVLQDNPKFKVGDLIVFTRKDGTREVLQVSDIMNGRYYFNHLLQLSWSIKECDEKCHRWTIKDAKDGDVLATKVGRPFIFKGLLDERHPESPVAYCGIDNTDDFIISNDLIPGTDNWWTSEVVYPATKEQRDLLFQKMHNAGYVWDAGNNELIPRPLDDIELIMYDYLSSDTCGELSKERIREVAINRAREIREKLK